MAGLGFFLVVVESLPGFEVTLVVCAPGRGGEATTTECGIALAVERPSLWGLVPCLLARWAIFFEARDLGTRAGPIADLVFAPRATSAAGPTRADMATLVDAGDPRKSGFTMICRS